MINWANSKFSNLALVETDGNVKRNIIAREIGRLGMKVDGETEWWKYTIVFKNSVDQVLKLSSHLNT